MSQTYDASQVIGKTLYAKAPVNLYRFATDNAPVIFTAQPGQAIGVVDTYLLPGPGRATLYWGFKDNNGRPYYVPHKTGLFSTTALQQQGAQTTQQQAAAAQAAAMTTGDKVMKTVKELGIIIALAMVGKSFFDSRKK